ncbi:MAG: GIY-YIG nuclease family protein [Selenomonadaceae bacterium]|nr:GIY-YIG nuclease family protein [Selenomonadaceae bacterium]
MDDIMDKSMVVYLLTDTTNGKQYVGQTTKTLRERIKRHKHSDLLVDRKINAHGWENCKIEILEECETYDELNRLEQEWIAALDTLHPNGYNLTEGGMGGPGHKLSEEAKQRISQKKKGCKYSAAVCKKISAAVTENMKNPELRRRLSEANKGKTHTEESRKKMSNTRKGRKRDEETKAKIGASNKGAHHSEETRRKMSEEHKKHHGPRKVLCVETGVVYDAIIDAARAYDIPQNCIVNVCRGRLMTAAKCHWIYFDECPLQSDGSPDLETIRGVLL